MTIPIDGKLSEIIRLGVIRIGSVIVQPGNKMLWSEISTLCSRLASKYKDSEWNAIPGVFDTRELYRSCGIDPTKTRPSSEALLRRTIKGIGLYRVNNLVDVCNWCSLGFQLPIGLYDTARIQGNIVCRFGHEGEFFHGIRKDDVNVGGRICMADDLGAFGSPTSDSARTMITENTVSALMILFFLKRTDDAVVLERTGKAFDRIKTFCGGNDITISI